MLIETKINKFLDELASDSDSFGGGAVGGVVAAAGISLILMSIKITIKRKSFNDMSPKVKQQVAAYIKTLEISKIAAEVITDADAQAFQDYMAAYRKKVASIENYAINSFNVPKQLADICIAALSTSKELNEYITGSIRSDLEMGQDLLKVTLKSALKNMKINLEQISNKEKHKEFVALKNEAEKVYGVSL
jgi:formiminotetrahydrofolate cyclodeaminase